MFTNTNSNGHSSLHTNTPSFQEVAACKRQKILQGFRQFDAKTSGTPSDHGEACRRLAMKQAWIRKNVDCQYPSPDSWGELAVMGNNENSLLGLPMVYDAEGDAIVEDFLPTLLSGNDLPQSEFIQVACGGSHSLALTKDGKVYSWGVGELGALGRDSNGAFIQQVPTLEKIVQVAAGDSHSLFLDSEGNVFMCGIYLHNELGHFSDPSVLADVKKSRSNMTPRLVTGLTDVIHIRAGGSMSAALTKGKQLYTWGLSLDGGLARSKSMNIHKFKETDEIMPSGQTEKYNTYDCEKMILGEGEAVQPNVLFEKFLRPHLVDWADGKPPADILDFACGKFHLLVVARMQGELNTRVFSSGGNNNGQLGLGNGRTHHALTEIKFLSDKHICAVAAGSYHSCFLSMSGLEVYTCGKNLDGVLGLGKAPSNTHPRTVPVPVIIAFPDTLASDDRIVDMSCGEEHTFAITAKGSLYSWGYNVANQTGFSCRRTEAILCPRKVEPMENITINHPEAKNCRVLRVDGGAQHTVVLLKRYQ